jgi:hypothetical protein
MGWRLRRAVRSEAGIGREGEKAEPRPKEIENPYLRGFCVAGLLSRILRQPRSLSPHQWLNHPVCGPEAMLQDRAGCRPRDAPVMHESHVHLADTRLVVASPSSVRRLQAADATPDAVAG